MFRGFSRALSNISLLTEIICLDWLLALSCSEREVVNFWALFIRLFWIFFSFNTTTSEWELFLGMWLLCYQLWFIFKTLCWSLSNPGLCPLWVDFLPRTIPVQNRFLDHKVYKIVITFFVRSWQLVFFLELDTFRPLLAGLSALFFIDFITLN